MTTEEFIETFRKLGSGGDEYLKGNRIKPERRFCRRKDLNAMVLLETLARGSEANLDADAICGTSHEEIYFEITPQYVAHSATEEDIRDLIRCGVRLDSNECFCMFV